MKHQTTLNLLNEENNSEFVNKKIEYCQRLNKCKL